MIPIELKPFPDEILSSWLIRNSIANGSDPSSWVDGIWMNYRAWNIDMDRHLSQSRINQLSNITSLDKMQIRNMTLEPTIEKIFSEHKLNPKKAWLFVVPTGSRGGRKINGTHFCKDCLKDRNPYIKKQWRLAWNVACPIHKTLLIHRCPKCNEAFSPHLINYKNIEIFKCTHCGFDLTKSDSISVCDEVINFQEKLNDIALGYCKSIDYPIMEKNISELFKTIRILFSFFRYTSFSVKHKNIFNKFGIDKSINISNYSNGTTFEAMSVEDRLQLLLVISKLAKFKINDIKNILLDEHIYKKSLLNQISLDSLTIDYLAEGLEESKDRIMVASKNNSIEPRSKEEVEKLMNEIRRFI